MGDILQSEEGPGVVFSATTTQGDKWMLEHYGDKKVTLSRAEASEFRRAAANAGLLVKAL